MAEHKVDFDALAWIDAAPGARYKVSKQGDTQLRLVEFSKEFVEPDWCIRGHIGYVLDGRMSIDFGGAVEAFAAGDGLFIPAGEEHKHKATVLTETVTLVLVESV